MFYAPVICNHGLIGLTLGDSGERCRVNTFRSLPQCWGRAGAVTSLKSRVIAVPKGDKGQSVG